MKRLGIILLIILLIIFIFIFQKSSPTVENNKLKVTSSFYPLYFFTSEIGQDKIEIKNITPAGVEPHEYEPTPQDIAFIEKSNLLILNGGDFESWTNKIKNDLKDTGIRIIEAGNGIFINNDPHVWLDPSLTITMANNITTALNQTDPKNENYYKNNYASLREKLIQLDQEYQNGLQNCKSKDIITSHSAFSYLAKRYGLNQVTITGLSPDEEPSAQKLAEIAKYAKERNVKYIFFESLVSPRLAETIAQEIGAKTLVLDPVEGITEKNMKKGVNYFTIMRENLKNLRIALTCQ